MNWNLLLEWKNNEVSFQLCIYFSFWSAGSTFICNTHIIPVKNQEGVAMMFIINFEYVTDEENVVSPEKCKPILPSKFVNRKLLFESSLLTSTLIWGSINLGNNDTEEMVQSPLSDSFNIKFKTIRS